MVFKIFGYFILGLSFLGVVYPLNKRLMDWLRFQSMGNRDYIVERLGMMFIEIPPNRIMLGLYGMSFGAGFLVFISMLPNIIPGLIFGTMVGVVGWMIPRPVVDYMYRKRTQKFVMQMIDALALMSNGLKSGLSIVQSLGLVTQEMPNPIQQEFGLILSQNKLGVALDECFLNLSKRIQSDDVEMFVTAINILRETGGDLAETFDTITTTMRERIKVENKISQMTAQGFYQGVFVMAIPPILGVVFYQTDPEFMKPLFTTWIGWVVIGVIFVLEVVGFIVIMKIIKIEV